MEDSIFAKIVRGEVPCHKIYEDDYALAFLDLFPKHEGHTLVIPKSAAQFVWDLNDADYAHVMLAAKKVARQIRQTLPYPMIHMGVVGTDVPYAHVHVIPFTSSTDLAAKQPDEPVADEILKALAEKLIL